MVHGLSFRPLLKEQLFLVAPRGARQMLSSRSSWRGLNDMDLLLPRQHGYALRYVDEAFATLQLTAHVVAEIESAATLSAAVAAGRRRHPAGVGGAGHGGSDPGRDVPDRLAHHRNTADPLRIGSPTAVQAQRRPVKDIILELIEQQTFDFGSRTTARAGVRSVLAGCSGSGLRQE